MGIVCSNIYNILALANVLLYLLVLLVGYIIVLSNLVEFDFGGPV